MADLTDLEQGKRQIYFIVDDESNAVKIGIADFPEWRMKGMQVGNPHRLRLVKTIPNGTHKLERRFHQLFSDYALGNEWFRLTDEIKEFLGEKKNKTEVQLDEEFRNFFPPLSDDQKTGLEQDILAHGCLAPLILWENTLIDGYHRYDICHKHGVPFQVVSFHFGNKLEAMYWLLAHQKNRRNLSKYELARRALMLRPIVEERARKRQQQAGELYHKGSPKVFLNQENLCIHTDMELAKLAGVSEDTIYKVETILESADQKTKEKLHKGEITINQAYVQIRRSVVDDQERKHPDLREQYKVGIRQGDFREVLSDLPDYSVDLILTDPPYGKSYLSLWSALGLFAGRVLRATGALVTYSGQLYLPQVISTLSEHLDWWWLCALIHQGNGNLTPLGQPVRKVINQFKPILIFVPRGGGINHVYRDLILGTGKDKSKHNWQQPVLEAKHILAMFCQPGDLVVDPFAGSGAIGQAAREFGCNFIGAEILRGDHAEV